MSKRFTQTTAQKTLSTMNTSPETWREGQRLITSYDMLLLPTDSRRLGDLCTGAVAEGKKAKTWTVCGRR